MFGLIFLQLDYDQQGVQNINGVLFLSICNSGFGTIFFVVNVIIMFIWNNYKFILTYLIV